MKSGDLNKIKLSLEAIKKICKKYRFMFRSDALYTEMNYMIENLSQLLIESLMVSCHFIKPIMIKFYRTQLML